MNERQFEKILSASAFRQTQIIIDSMPTDQELEDILPSSDLESRINSLIQKHNKKCNLQGIRRRIGIFAASILVVFSISFGMLFTVNASRDNIIHFFDRYFAYNSGEPQTWDTQFNAQIRDSVHNVYLPTWVPDKFKATMSQEANNVCFISYQNTDKTIRFYQSSASEKIYNDSELNQMEQIQFSGQKYYYGEKASGNQTERKLVWNTGKNTYIVVSNVSKPEILKFAQNLKFKEG